MLHKKHIYNIKKLMPALPESDRSLGLKFLEERNIESLKMLVDSAIIRTKKGLLKENPKEEYLNVDFENLYKLQSIVDDYYSDFIIPEDYEFIDEYLT